MSKKKKHAKHEEEVGEDWLLPYSDLMTLLLAVFIVLFAVSQMDLKKAQELSQSFSETMMTKSYTAAKMNEESKTQSPSSNKSEMQQMKELKSNLDKKVEKENMTDSVTTVIDKRGLVISLNNAMLFDPGSAEIKKEHEKVLLEIGDKINTMNHFVLIEGHTDNVPMNSDRYPSNWDLSTARANNVLRLLINKSDTSPKKFIAAGYGEYRPVADNSTEEGRAKNRRTDIIVLKDKFNDIAQ